MRTIAAAAHTSLGNSYYYFASKDHLVQAFYERMHQERIALVGDSLLTERSLRARLRLAMKARLDAAQPYHAVSATLFRTAADPESPLNPFSATSHPVRNACVDFLREVVDGSDARIPRDLAPALPHLLWLYELGLVFFWLHDRSPGQAKSYELADDTADVIVRLLAIAHLPVLRTVRRKVLRWVSSLISEGPA
jgi:AcrR family transcriptional regulator